MNGHAAETVSSCLLAMPPLNGATVDGWESRVTERGWLATTLRATVHGRPAAVAFALAPSAFEPGGLPDLTKHVRGVVVGHLARLVADPHRPAAETAKGAHRP